MLCTLGCGAFGHLLCFAVGSGPLRDLLMCSGRFFRHLFSVERPQGVSMQVGHHLAQLAACTTSSGKIQSRAVSSMWRYLVWPQEMLESLGDVSWGGLCKLQWISSGWWCFWLLMWLLCCRSALRWSILCFFAGRSPDAGPLISHFSLLFFRGINPRALGTSSAGYCCF